ncbi:MAG: YraN family protein [Patescibacteria group bacterium]|nr:YraN family protein [Patescibacteria group bacterium]
MEGLSVGQRGEEIAADYVSKRGYKILARNWKSKRWGELDIVAKDHEDLVFIEVKTRSVGSLGKPFEAVNYYKLKSLVRTANNYRMTGANSSLPLRIDVVSIVLTEPPEIEYFKSVYTES